MFADLNRYAVRPTTSLGLLYDHRDEMAFVAKELTHRVPVFTDLTETERSSISNRSIKLFTLSGLYHATQALLSGLELQTADERINLAAEFWTEVSKHIADWQMVKDRKVSAADLRQNYIHAHTLCLAALARAGNDLLKHHRRDWKTRLRDLSTLDWSRNNASQWEGRAMNAGRLSKRNVNVALTANLVKKHLGLKLSAEEQELEQEFRRNHDGRRNR
jgi:DNA sulfur modification protein DndB